MNVGVRNQIRYSVRQRFRISWRNRVTSNPVLNLVVSSWSYRTNHRYSTRHCLTIVIGKPSLSDGKMQMSDAQ